MVGPGTPPHEMLQPKGCYESISLVVFLCILLVVAIVDIMDFSGYLVTLSCNL